ncbi:MAG: S41 family peptidase [Pseudomonadota bacterium]|nr:S41 family peptidase [Pseudomonadota bacterium]
MARLMAAAAVTLAGAATAGKAEEPATAAQPAPIDGRAVEEEARRAIRENYVVTDKLEAVDAILAKGVATGRYEVADPRQLAERINADLMSAANDKHLSIQFDPVRASMLKGPIGDEVAEGPQWERMAQLRNHGFTEMRVLDGNVRYANLEGFVWTGEKSAAAFDTAMNFLKEGDAAIIDLRYNGGGSPKAIQYLISHFVEPGTPLTTFYMGGGKAPDRQVALTKLPAGRMVGKPLYVLTSRISISAAEDFAGHVGGYRLGEIVGETTAGAAYRNSFFPIRGQFMLSVSVGKAVLASTGGNWEGTGIKPTITTDAHSALDAAHLHALRKLAAAAPPPEKSRMEAMATVLAARLEPKSPDLPLAAYAGAFGDRTISLEGGVLHSQRAGGPKAKLLSLGANLFVIEADLGTRLEFAVADGGAASLDVIRGDGRRMTQARTK